MVRPDVPLPDWHAPRADTVSPDRTSVQAWLDAYVRAWQSFDPGEIADVWTEDATWYRPFDVRAQGRAAITAAGWRNSISTRRATTTRATSRSPSTATLS